MRDYTNITKPFFIISILYLFHVPLFILDLIYSKDSLSCGGDHRFTISHYLLGSGIIGFLSAIHPPLYIIPIYHGSWKISLYISIFIISLRWIWIVPVIYVILYQYRDCNYEENPLHLYLNLSWITYLVLNLLITTVSVYFYKEAKKIFTNNQEDLESESQINIV